MLFKTIEVYPLLTSFKICKELLTGKINGKDLDNYVKLIGIGCFLDNNIAMIELFFKEDHALNSKIFELRKKEIQFYIDILSYITSITIITNKEIIKENQGDVEYEKVCKNTLKLLKRKLKCQK